MWNWRNRNSEPVTDEGSAEVGGLLREMASNRTAPNPFFAKRVMAAIEAREAELSSRVRAWAAVPAFASRVSAIAVVLLLLAGTWLYTGNSRRSNLASSGGLFEDSAAAASSSAQDDVFSIAAEGAR
ncbi:MAG TPA: hypothetical protein VKT53_04325 [Candidatus Acidoferrum sp.]|nr:hypothetical protein [Candidatus Acidoferrum sp.]